MESSDEESSQRERGQLWTAQQWAEWRREFEATCHKRILWQAEIFQCVDVVLSIRAEGALNCFSVPS